MTAKGCYLNAVGTLSAAGDSAASIRQRLQGSVTDLTMTDAYSAGVSLPIGLYHGALPEIPLPEPRWQSRNNRFALAALNQIRAEVTEAVQKYGSHRVGVVIGTSTSGIAESEACIRQWVETEDVPAKYDYGLQEMGATSQFIARVLGAQGPAYGISTACSSGAKALATARRLIRSGICDAVIAGGVDTLCHLTVQGFSSLEAVSNRQCNPFSANRSGINIGEGAALFLVTAEATGVELLGVGEGSDAHHISAPDPTGSGAVRCMQAALDDASLSVADIDYINLHGTATALNDQMESIAVSELFRTNTYCSSTKPFTGHTLGAAGAVEAAICWLAIVEDFLPVHVWDQQQDPELPALKMVESGARLAEPLRYALSNSFAFGGNNIALLLGRI